MVIPLQLQVKFTQITPFTMYLHNAETATRVNWYLISGEGDCGEADCGEGEWIPTKISAIYCYFSSF